MEYKRTNEEIAKELESFVSILEIKKSFDKHSLFTYERNKGNITEQKWLDYTQGVLDWAGLIPAYGDAIDIVNGIIYLIRGKYVDGILSIVAAIPVVGSVIALPLKAAFKFIPINSIKIIGTAILSGKGIKAAEEFLKYSSNPKVRNAIMTIGKYGTMLNPKFALIRAMLEKLMKFIPGKLDDKLLGFINKGIKGLEDFLVKLAKGSSEKIATKAAKTGLKIPMITGKYVTKKGGRLMAQSGLALSTLGARRTFYATQDMFMDYLRKEGTSLIPSNLRAKYIGAAQQSLIERGIKNASNEQIEREFTNLVMLNDVEMFNKFLSSPSSTKRWESALKAMDPSIVKDATTWYSRLTKTGYKVVRNTLLLSDSPTEEEYIEKREMDSYKSDIDKSEKSRSGDHYGKRRNY